MEWGEILAGLRLRQNTVRRMDEWTDYVGLNTLLAAPIPQPLPEYPRKKTRGMGRVALLALAATDKALHMAGLTDAPLLKNGRCGVAYGSSLGSVPPLMDFYRLLVDKDSRDMNATTYIKAMPHTCAANLEVSYGLTGRIIPTNTACTSGSMAIGYAYEAIRYGLQEVMLAGGAEELSIADVAVFDTLFATSTQNHTPHLTPAPYDKNRDGLVVGEGAGTLILEERNHALARGAPIYAEVVGFGSNTDGVHITQPNRETMKGALLLALEDARLSPDAVGYVNTHGTGTGVGDVAESHATREVFGRAVAASTLKSYLGHTLGACGAIEAWLSIRMLNEGWFAPNLNLRELDAACAELDYVTGEGRALEAEYVMSNNFAFGGINTSLIFKRGG